LGAEVYVVLFPTVGTILSYVFYWLAVIAVLVVMKFKEVSFMIQQPPAFMVDNRTLNGRAAPKYSASNQLLVNAATHKLEREWP
jgi:hypothetical protein